MGIYNKMFRFYFEKLLEKLWKEQLSCFIILRHTIKFIIKLHDLFEKLEFFCFYNFMYFNKRKIINKRDKKNDENISVRKTP